MTNIFDEGYTNGIVRWRLMIAALLGGILQMTAEAQQTPDQKQTTPETFVDALNSAFGKQTTNRATHAKGIVLLGNFTPNAANRALLFMPRMLPDGIAPADPMIQFRNKTYPVSYDRRHQKQ